jgi:ferredoxin-NADP reductase/MOSC domain-containing protein YiiM
MTVLSVNIGRTRQVTIHGKPEPTSFIKEAIAGPVSITFEGIVSNELGTGRALGIRNHAVFVFSHQHYAHWEKDLHRPALPFGSFGENLTVSCLDESITRVGDELSIGTAILRVVQPRIPCYKLAHFLDAPQDFPMKYLKSTKVGVYCSVVREGEIEAGDAITLVRTDLKNSTVAEFVRVTQFDTTDVVGLTTLLDSPGLIPEWKARVERLLDSAAESGSAARSWKGWRQLACVARQDESEDVASFYFAAPDRQPLSACRPGQFLTLKLTPEGGLPMIRSYTISGAIPTFDAPSQYRLTVKREQKDGNTPSASTFLHCFCQQDTVVEARAPSGAFTVRPEERQPIVFVSSGIGLTPMLAMLTGMAECEDPRPLLWFHGARSRRQHPLQAEQMALTKRLPGLRVHLYHSQPSRDERAGHDYHRSGRLDAAEIFAESPAGAVFYVCGPGPFMADIVQGLLDQGVGRDRIRTEAFGSSSIQIRKSLAQGTPPAQEARVRFEPAGVEAEWHPQDGTLLDFLERLGLTKDASCRSGICRTCAATLVSGVVSYPDSIEPPEDDRTVVLCSARPASDLVVHL